MLEYDSIWLDSFKIYFSSLLLAKIVTLLLYPLAGLLAETVLTRFKVMLIATVVGMAGLMLALVSIVADAVQFEVNDDRTTVKGWKNLLKPSFVVPSLIGVTIHYLGLGMFEANAIQFGVDQLQFANNEELSKFIHWYFWTIFIFHCMLISLSLFLGKIWVAVFLLLVIAIICFVAIVLLICFQHKHLVKEPVGKNPVLLILRVLNYARQHKKPAWRSAFTYGEGLYSRLDLGKERYGGPFSTEQVEDVKSFGRIFIVLLSLFGLMTTDGVLTLASDIFSNYYLTPAYSLKSAFEYQYAIGHTTFTKTYFFLVLIIGLPIYLCLRPFAYQHVNSILKRIGIGLFMIVMALVLTVVYNAMMYIGYAHHNILCFSNETIFGHLPDTYDFEGYQIFLLIAAQVFNGLGYLLVFLPALEFILAQAPRSMQGLLIGLWYAYQSVGVIIRLVSVLTLKETHCHYWTTTVKTVFAILSLLAFLVAARLYKYCERDELSNINAQTIIEEYTERHLINKNSSSESTSESFNISY